MPLPYLAVVVLLLGFGAGYQVKSTLFKVAMTQDLIEKSNQLYQSKIDNKKLSRELVEKETKVRVVTNTIIKRIPKYVTKIQKSDSDCNITDGTKRMLNKLINL